MIIKKFQGKTENDAIEAAKKEMGNNIVTMNVRSVKRKGILRFFLKDLVEVTVALEEENEKYKPIKKEEKKETIPVVPVRRAVPEEVKGERRDNALLEEKLDNLHSLLEQQLQKPEEEKAEEEEEEKPPSEFEKLMKLLYNTMLDNEVDEKYANQIIDEMEKSAKPNMPFDYALTNVYQKMVLKFGKPEGISPAENGTKVIFFIGPTGVGKTTTIAKLASFYIVDEKKKVALITSDTYRIAAAEQLRTYAGILEVPFRVVYSPEEIQQSLGIFSGYDYIFIDTSGHSYQNEEQKQSMSRIVHSIDGEAETEVYLVLSATTKYKDLLKIVDAYSEITEFKLIFTKLDETSSLGNLLNIKLYTGTALSYITCGQNVPDDFCVFSPQDAVRQLLGGKN
ncbi:MAG: flagellar biosynthesis protein FlhF [Lachnospiraceae bacterium]|jgi:flagellar biosynthesis protein FlhF|nr:flagellar biosynthesis protein FlhF [Lachnospiraceae bacterium]